MLNLSGISVIEKELMEDFYFTNLEDGKYYYFNSEKQKLVDVSVNLSLGGSSSDKKLYHPEGISFYSTGYWSTQF